MIIDYVLYTEKGQPGRDLSIHYRRGDSNKRKHLLKAKRWLYIYIEGSLERQGQTFEAPIIKKG